jgi:ligand-binding sensor domain-containing protein
MRRLTASLLILLTGITGLTGQTVPAWHISAASPVSGLSVSLIAEDSAGFVWLATNEGLLRFDGRHTDKPGWTKELPATPVTALTVYRNWLIMGFEDGTVARKDPEASSAAESWKVCNSPVITLATNSQGTIFAGTRGEGFATISEGRTFLTGTSQGLGDPVVHAVAAAGRQLLAATDYGLYVFEPGNSGLSLVQSLFQEDGIPDNLITALAVSGSGHVIAGSHNGRICRLRADGSSLFVPEVFPEKTDAPITQILISGAQIHVLTESGSWWIIDSEHPERTRKLNWQNQETTAPVKHAIINREGLLLTANGGHTILAADPLVEQFSEHDGESLREIRAMTCDNQNRIWFSDGENLLMHDADFSSDAVIRLYRIRALPTGARIISMKAAGSAVWLGTFGHGLIRFDPIAESEALYDESDGLINNNVLDLALTGDTLWLATLGGLGYVIPKASPVFGGRELKSPLGNEFIYALHSAGDGALWIGTDGRGPVSRKSGRFTFLTEGHDSCGKNVVGITTAVNGHSWFHSTDKGLQIFDGHRVKSVPLRRNETQPEIFSATPYGSSGLLVSTNMGIALLRTPQSAPLFLTSGNGIAQDALNAIVKDLSGRVWVGMSDGLLCIRPLPQGRENLPRTRLREMMVNLQPHSPQDSMLEAGQNHLTFRLGGIWFRNPEDIRFRYRLEGYDLGWNESAEDVVVYSQLKPGSYTLHVQSLTGQSGSSSEEFTYSFRIHPPFWKTWWFILLAASAVAGGIYVYIRLREKKLRREEQVKLALLQSQFETLRNQVNPHFIFNAFNTLAALIEESPAEAVGYVESLSEFFRHVLQVRDRSLITMREELELVNRYFYIQKKRFGENIRWQATLGEKEMDSLVPPMSIQILGENALKHNIVSATRPLVIELYAEGDRIVMRNTLQPLAQPGKSTGIGLANVRERYHVLTGKEVEVDTREGYFSVRMPLIPDHS